MSALLSLSSQCTFELYKSEESGSDESDSDDGQSDGDSEGGDVVPYEKSMAEGSVPPASDAAKSNISKPVDVQEGNGVEESEMEERNHHRSYPGKNLFGQDGGQIGELRIGEHEQQDDVGEGGEVEDLDDVDHPATHVAVEIQKEVEPSLQKRKRKGVGGEKEEERFRSYRTRAKKRASMDAKKQVLRPRGNG